MFKACYVLLVSFAALKQRNLKWQLPSLSQVSNQIKASNGHNLKKQFNWKSDGLNVMNLNLVHDVWPENYDVFSRPCYVLLVSFAALKQRNLKWQLPSLSTHVTELWVARLRVWDQFRSMLAVNSTLLSDDQGLKHFNAQEWKRGTHGSPTCILRKMQKERSLMPLAMIKINIQLATHKDSNPDPHNHDCRTFPLGHCVFLRWKLVIT